MEKKTEANNFCSSEIAHIVSARNFSNGGIMCQAIARTRLLQNINLLMEKRRKNVLINIWIEAE